MVVRGMDSSVDDDFESILNHATILNIMKNSSPNGSSWLLLLKPPLAIPSHHPLQVPFQLTPMINPNFPVIQLIIHLSRPQVLSLFPQRLRCHIPQKPIRKYQFYQNWKNNR